MYWINIFLHRLSSTRHRLRTLKLMYAYLSASHIYGAYQMQCQLIGDADTIVELLARKLDWNISPPTPARPTASAKPQKWRKIMRTSGSQTYKNRQANVFVILASNLTVIKQIYIIPRLRQGAVLRRVFDARGLGLYGSFRHRITL